jgi:multisubunit Na+/H+ antiporter MnhG subunit
MAIILSALTLLIGVFFSFVGSIKCGGGAINPPMYEMQLGVIGQRYQPALATQFEKVAPPVAAWFRQLPAKHVLVLAGAPELLFGVVCLLSLVGGFSGVANQMNKLMVIFMVAGPMAAHWFGDDWSLPNDHPNGPTGIIPAAVCTVLVVIRLLLLPSGNAKTSSGKAKKA